MHNGKTNKSKHILTVALASLIVLTATSAAVMSGCGESSESTNETKTVTETELVTVVVDGTYATDANGNTVSAENTGSQTSSNGNGSSEKNESSSSQNANNSGSSSANSSSGGNSSNNSASSNSGNSNNNNGNNSISANNSSSSSSGNSSSSSNTHKPVNDSNACTLDGNKFAVGDTVTCVYKLYAPEVLENYQGYISYDTKYLSVKSAKLDGPAKSSGLLNYKLNGKIKFNGSNIATGYDYTDTGSFIVVNYEIKAAGSTTPKFVWEVATGESEKAYVENNKAVNGLKLTKEYS